MDPLASPKKEKTEQVDYKQPNSPRNISFSQTTNDSQIMHAASNDYFRRDTITVPTKEDAPIPHAALPIAAVNARLEEIYDNSPLLQTSDTDESIYDNEIISSSSSEENIYDNDLVVTKPDSEDDENIYDNDLVPTKPDSEDDENIYDNDLVLTKPDSEDDDDEENIYDNDVANNEIDAFLSTTSVIANSNTDDVGDRLYYETVDQWVPQIARDRKRSNNPPPLSPKEAGHIESNPSPPLEDDEGYVDVTPFQQTPLVNNEDIYDN